MVKISRKVEYALMALQHMRGQRAGQVISAKDLCATYRVAFPILSKVLQNLAAAGVLRSAQGAHGGYQLARPLTDVTFGELSEAVLGPMQFSYCLHRDRVRCQLAECCNVISPIVRLSNRIEELFYSMSLEELLHAEEPQEAAIRARHNVSGATQRARPACSAGRQSTRRGRAPGAVDMEIAAHETGQSTALTKEQAGRELSGRVYEHGFYTDIDADQAPKGLNEDIIRFISRKKGDPPFMLDFRLKALRRWSEMEDPWWRPVDHPPIDYQAIRYYSAPKSAGDKEGPASLDEVDPESCAPSSASACR